MRSLGRPTMARSPRTTTGRCSSAGRCSEQLDHGIALDVVGRVEAELLEHGVLAHEVGDGVLEPVRDPLERRAVGPLLQVEDDVVVDSELVGDRDRVPRGVAVRIVEDRHVGHAADASGRLVDKRRA